MTPKGVRHRFSPFFGPALAEQGRIRSGPMNIPFLDGGPWWERAFVQQG